MVFLDSDDANRTVQYMSLTLNVYAHTLPNEKADLSYLPGPRGAASRHQAVAPVCRDSKRRSANEHRSRPIRMVSIQCMVWILTRSAFINDHAVAVAAYSGHVSAFQGALRRALPVEPSLSREFSFAPS